MIEYALLSSQLARLILPRLPQLKKAGLSAATTVAQAASDEASQAVRRLWDRLMEKVRDNPAAEQTIEDAAARPDDPRSEAALSFTFERLLREDEAFARTIQELVEAASRGPVAGRDNVTVHGDGAVVQTGKYNLNFGKVGKVNVEGND